MTSLTKHDELLVFVKYFTGRGVVPIEPLETPIKEAPAVHKKCPLRTAEEAFLVNNMFASFLSSGKPGYVIAVSGGFVANGRYRVVGAGNTGKKGVRRPSDELCAKLAQACTEFISGNTMPRNPNDMSAILVASLNICHAEVAHRLITIHEGSKLITPTMSSTGIPNKRGLKQLYSNLCSAVAPLKDDLKRWGTLGSQDKSEVATRYAKLLKVASKLWDATKDLGSIQSKPQMQHLYTLNAIAKGLQLLCGFPHGTRVDFNWPQGPINGDAFTYQPANAKTALLQTMTGDLIDKSAIRDHKLRKKMRTKRKKAAILQTEYQFHCEIYLALHILFSESAVQFHSFRVEEGKRVFTIGCSKASCVGCWDILLGLARQDSSNHPIYVCRTRHSHGKCYATWGLTPRVKFLPSSLRQEVTGLKKTQMLNSLNQAIKYCHHEFKQRIESSM